MSAQKTWNHDADTACWGVRAVVIRFSDRPSDTVHAVLEGRDFHYANRAWHGIGVPEELAALVRSCGGVVEVNEKFAAKPLEW
ncbi:hypothetical protein [Azospirillum sp.]|uniref:hypothetical protein n=1 Tax=Azospirillum sp. TaxID=34012 RepID=UPI002D51B3CE|nr:hypothetical protein [Azospirillum sp.]HYD64576.1 hypothetical protein [Azospirillum sp.]